MARPKTAKRRRGDKLFVWDDQASNCDIAARRAYVEAAKREILRRAAEEAEVLQLRREIVQAPLRFAPVGLLPSSDTVDQHVDHG